MVAGKVKSVIGLQKQSPTPTSTSKQPQKSTSTTGFSRSFGVYFPRSSAQVQPKPPDVTELLRIVEALRESESRLKTELLEQKLLKESVAIVPILENVISNKDTEIEKSKKKIECLETENERLRNENEILHLELSKQNKNYEERIGNMQSELAEIKRAVATSSTLTTNTNNNTSFKYSTSSKSFKKFGGGNFIETKKDDDEVEKLRSYNSEEISEEVSVETRSRIPRVPKPPPRSIFSSSSLSVSSSSSYSSLSDSADRVISEISNIPKSKEAPPPPPPPPPPKMPVKVVTSAPPPPLKGGKAVPAKVRRIPEVVEFYHSLMRRDSACRKDAGAGDGQVAGATAKDMIGEIENRSAYLLAIKTDVETQGDFIRFLIKEVEGAAFTDIEDVVPFVKWLDDELSYLVDERAVLKHFDWPEKKADALREAAFGYCDLKKLESEVSSFRDDHRRQPCGPALKKMQSLFEKLEHAVYNLSRMRESAGNRFKGFQIPTNWMTDTGYVSQIKLASVKLAMKYMRRVSAELEMVGSGPEEEDLIVQGVKFAFRVHQFAGGFDVETMTAFEELRDKARSCNAQCQNQQKFVCRQS